MEISKELVTGPPRATRVEWLGILPIVSVTVASMAGTAFYRNTVADFQEGTINFPHTEVLLVSGQLDSFFKANVFCEMPPQLMLQS